MTGYHAQLMTGGVGARGLLPPPRRARNARAPSYRERRAHPPFAHPFPPRVDGSRGSGEEFSFRVDDVGPGDAQDDDTFEFDVGGGSLAEFDVGGVPRASPSVSSLGVPTHSAHRAQSKRRAAELATLRAERAFAEAAVATDGLETIRLAEEVRELKAIVAGLVRSASLAGERRRDDAEKVTTPRRKPSRRRTRRRRKRDETTTRRRVRRPRSGARRPSRSYRRRRPRARSRRAPRTRRRLLARRPSPPSRRRRPRARPVAHATPTPTHAPTIAPTPAATPASVVVSSARLSPSPAPAMDVSLATDAEAFFRRAGDADESVSASVAVGSDDDDTAEVR